MKIQSITSLNSLNSNSYRRNNPAPTKYSQTNFLGTLSAKDLKKFPLENKLSHLFTNCNIGDIVAVGKNFEEVQNGLARTVCVFSDIIKRIIFVKHGGLSVPLAFAPVAKNVWGCANIGDKNILIAKENSTEDIPSKDSCIIDDGDVIINNKVTIPIFTEADYREHMKDTDDMLLLMDPENFATKTYNFADIQEKWIEDANREALSTLSANKQKTIEKENKTTSKLSFKDIGGMDKTIETLKRSILYPIKYPYAYENLSVNKGILLYGKPGTGKTLLAEALVEEANAEFIKISGTDYESKWVGETEEKWRETFDTARQNQPSIIFIDEFDAVVRERGRSKGSDHSDKVVNQILSLMSDLEKSNDDVFVIATTNKPETIDSAIMRSGRFGKHIEIPTPDKEGLASIFDIHTRNRILDNNLNKNKLIEMFFSRQFTGADIKHVVNEAHTNSWNRLGIYEKMEAGTLKQEDIRNVSITEEDFILALNDWDNNQTKKNRKPIGFNN